MSEIITYETSGTCCRIIQIEVEGDTIKDVNFRGGCAGNLMGIRALVRGRKIDEVVEMLDGIPCGTKGTSCPDQLAKSLIQYKSRKELTVG